jgi:signal transduction histidine kinase
MIESVDLNEAALEVIALLLNGIQTNRVVLRTEFAADLPTVEGDRVQLQQVILNLIRNSIDSMTTVDDRIRHLLVKTKREEDNHIRLTVKDTGIGLAPDAMDRVFESFYTTKSGGMGIGLTICRSIIQGHQGRLWAETNDGPGVTFSFSIPWQFEQPARVSGLDAGVRPEAIADT